MPGCGLDNEGGAMRTLITALVLFLPILSVSSIAQVTLPNGTTVPKERMIVFLFAGHSNMAGRCTPDDQTTHPRCWAYGASGHNYWEPCKDRIFTNSRGAGPATAFLKKLADNYPQFHFGVIQNANSQAGVRWHNGNSNNRYWKGAGRYEELIGFAKDLQGKVTFGGIVTMLGLMEATSGSSSYWNTFADDFKRMVNDMRSDLGLTATRLPVLVQDYEMEACGGFAPTLAGPQAIIAQVANIPSKLGSNNAAVISTDGIPCPDQCHHFNWNGMKTWTTRAYNTYVNKGWDFWATVESDPPTVPSNVRAGAVDFTSIQLQWNASTDASGVDHYTVFWGTQNREVSGTQTTITGLTACTDYTFQVSATDNNGNTSNKSAGVTIKTECCSDDNTAPSAPTLSAGTVTSTSASLSWTQSTDNTGVSGYEVYNGGTLAATTSGASATSKTITGLSASTAYSFTVKAVDICGNHSTASNTVNVTTPDRLVASLPLKVNIGGPAAGGFTADKQWQDGADYGYTGSSSAITVTDAVAGTDLDAVYQSLRYTEGDGVTSGTQAFGYKVAVPNGDYVVTFMFAEFWRNSAGGREIDVALEGQKLPECPIDILAAAGKATAYDVTKSIQITDGFIDVQLSVVTSDPLLNGLMIESAGEVAAYTITSPQNGDVYTVGDTLTFEFSANTAIVQDANFEMSDNEGETWYNLMFDGSVSASDPAWGRYKVAIPAAVEGIPVGGKDWWLRVRDYDNVYSAQMAGTIHINPTAVSVTPQAAPRAAAIRHDAAEGRLILQSPSGERAMIELTTLNGSVVRRSTVPAAGKISLDLTPLSRGVYIVNMRTPTAMTTRRLMLQ
ncbi:MAG: T9SS type A sorting domain-containing protein [Chitinivibrionales bacterium]|nr:T9SS type A sorting domain-containing protein [Chitinivibrionales bacterium]